MNIETHKAKAYFIIHIKFIFLQYDLFHYIYFIRMNTLSQLM